MTQRPSQQIAPIYHRRIGDMAAADRLLVTGMHLHYTGFGHIARDANNYRFVPEPWQ